MVLVAMRLHLAHEPTVCYQQLVPRHLSAVDTACEWWNRSRWNTCTFRGVTHGANVIT